MGGGLSCPFSKIGQKCPNFWKKGPDCGHRWAKFLILNAILKSFQEKKLEIFPCGAFVSRVVLYMDVYQSALIPRKLPFPKNFLVTRLDRYVFYVTVKTLNSFNALTLKQIFWKTKTFFKKVEYDF